MSSEPTIAPLSPLPYVIPMGGFLALTALEAYLPRAAGQTFSPWYPLAYTIKVAIVTALIAACRSSFRDLTPRPTARMAALAVLLGLVVAALWVGLDGLYPDLPFLGKREAFDPHVLSPAGRWGFIAVRLLGLAALVPLVEELFWRSFLIRWVIDPEFYRVPVGKVTPVAAVVSSTCFALAHPEWLPGLLTGLIWSWLVWRTKSISACVISHAVANLALGIYVIATGDWKFW